MFILKGIKNFYPICTIIALQSFVLLYTWALLNISFTLSVQLLFYLAFHVLPVVSRGLGAVFSQPIFQLLFRWTPASFFWFHTFFIFGFINIYSKKAALSDVHHLSARYRCLWHLYFTPVHTYAPELPTNGIIINPWQSDVLPDYQGFIIFLTLMQGYSIHSALMLLQQFLIQQSIKLNI